jgi:putative phage-type endonuclease
MTDDFHERRRTGLGGSDAAAALGISPWRTPYDLWLEKTGQSDVMTLTATEPMRWGVLLEPVIRAEYSRRTGRGFLVQQEMLRHPSHSWMIAHLDGTVYDPTTPRILEVKTARDGRGWGEPGSDEIPLHYLVQVHHYLIVSGAEIADLAVLIGGSDFRIYQIHADAAIAEQLVEREAEFWRQVERREPPDPVNLHDAVSRWGRLLIEGAVEADQFEIDAIESLRRFREQRKALDEAEENAKLIVMQALGENGDTLVDANGTRLATWALDKGRKGYTVEAKEPSRRFLLKG